MPTLYRIFGLLLFCLYSFPKGYIIFISKYIFIFFIATTLNA